MFVNLFDFVFVQTFVCGGACNKKQNAASIPVDEEDDQENMETMPLTPNSPSRSTTSTGSVPVTPQASTTSAMDRMRAAASHKSFFAPSTSSASSSNRKQRENSPKNLKKQLLKIHFLKDVPNEGDELYVIASLQNVASTEIRKFMEGKCFVNFILIFKLILLYYLYRFRRSSNLWTSYA